MSKRQFEIEAMRIWVNYLAKIAALEFVHQGALPWRELVATKAFKHFVS